MMKEFATKAEHGQRKLRTTHYEQRTSVELQTPNPELRTPNFLLTLPPTRDNNKGVGE
jgi:hypothetical protein